MAASTNVFRKDLLQGKVVFCTGGATGICYTMVEGLMRHGAKAAIIGRRQAVVRESAAKLSADTSSNCIGISADVRNLSSVEQAVAQTIHTFGRIDFVINGAAGNFLAPIDGLSPNAFKTVMDIDLMGTYNATKATIEHVKRAKGSYIAVSATLQYTGKILQAHVSAAKAAIDALSRVMALEYGPRGVRFNVIAPAGTEGFDRLSRYKAEEGQKSVPLQRFGTKDDIANATLFLFSEASSYITGQILVVDGGHIQSSGQLAPYPETVLDTAGFREKLTKL